MLSTTATAPASSPAPTHPPRAPKTMALEELATRADALALGIGSRITASVILLACVIVILVGAQTLLSTMEAMDRDLEEMTEQLAIANDGLDVLNDTMDSVPPSARHVGAIRATLEDTSKEAKVSVRHIEKMTGTTDQLNDQVGAIAGSTTAMRTSLEGAAGDTEELSTTIGALSGGIDPLVKTQHEMLLGTRRMRSGLDGMNASLAYVVRIMNYIAAPPTGGGMTIRADLSKQTLPPIPGIKAEVEPVPVFPRNIWPVYKGP